MKKPENYISLAQLGQAQELVINKSRFLGYAKSTMHEDMALEFIDEIRQIHPECSCICYAYICELTSNIQRFDDGHEPVGGIPILEAIKHNNLVGVTCVVVRYYGGTKLGIGGLARAFSKSAAHAITAGIPSLYEMTHIYDLCYDYSFSGKIDYMLENFPCKISNKEYTEKVLLTIMIKDKDIEKFNKKLCSITNDKHTLVKTDELYSC